MAFRLANVDGRAMLVDGEALHDLEAASGGTLGWDPMDALATHEALHDVDALLAGRSPEVTLDDVQLGPPVPAPRSIFGVGLNYRDHAAESGIDLPETPLVFAKFPNCITGPDAHVELDGTAVDYEAELVVVIGTGGRDITPEVAWSHVAGVTAGQDISDRALQFAAKPPHFDLGKSRDGYGPIGPWVVSTDLLEDRDALPLSCTVNGETRQDSTTAELVFDVPALIAYLSGILTLAPGDLIFTGTPSGVGAATGNFLAPGDVVVTTLGGVGSFTTTFA